MLANQWQKANPALNRPSTIPNGISGRGQFTRSGSRTDAPMGHPVKWR